MILCDFCCFCFFFFLLFFFVFFASLVDSFPLFIAEQELRDLEAKFDKTEDHLKALQSIGQFIGEVLRQLGEEKCKSMIQSFSV